MRERLIELFRKTNYQSRENGLTSNLGTQFTDFAIEQIVDKLLAEGVIVPPCKVGDTVWFPSQYYDRPYQLIITKIEIYEEETIIYSEGGAEWHYEDIGKTVFLTREEAEKALAEREKYDSGK